MDAGIKVTVDDSEVRRAMRGFERSIPFALAHALTKTAQAAQKQVRAELGRSVTLRSGWVSKGIVIQPATKATLTSAVGTVDPIMATLATGGTRPEDGGKSPMVPQIGKGLPRATLATATRPAKFPGKLLEIPNRSTGQPDYFVGRGGGKLSAGSVYRKTGKLIARRRWHAGSGPMVRQRMPFRLAWAHPSHKISLKKRWDLQGQVEVVVLRHWARIAAESVQYAIDRFRP